MAEEYIVWIIWSEARKFETEIINEITKKFEIVKKYYVTWPKERFGVNLSAFYGDQFWDEPFQVFTRGTGEFLMLVCRDMHPCYESRMTGRGIKNVNVNSFELKQKIRGGIIKNMAVHAANDTAETKRALALILGRSLKDLLADGAFDGTDESIEKDVEGVDGWENLEHLFYILNESCEYVVLRGFDDLPGRHRMDVQGDVDLLVSDLQAFLVFLNPYYEIKKNAFRFMNYIDLKDQNILIHPKFIGDNYYSYEFEREIMHSRKRNDAGIYIPSEEMLFWSLLYHGIFHKRNVKKYDSLLFGLAQKMQIDYRSDEGHLQYLLADWLAKKGYYVKKHLDPDCGVLQEACIPYKRLISKKRRIYLYHTYYKGQMVSSTLFDEEMIRLEPELLTQIIKPMELFLDLDRHVLREDSKLYQILSQDGHQSEFLWRYELRFGEVMELKYVNPGGTEPFFQKQFLGCRTSADDGVVQYKEEGRIPVIRGQLLSHYLKKKCCEGKAAFEHEIYLFVDQVMETFGYDGQQVSEEAWDMLPKNCFLTDQGEYVFFDKEASLRKPMDKIHLSALQAAYMKDLASLPDQYMYELFDKFMMRYFGRHGEKEVMDRYLMMQEEVVDRVNSIPLVKERQNEDLYAVYISVSAYVPDGMPNEPDGMSDKLDGMPNELDGVSNESDRVLNGPNGAANELDKVSNESVGMLNGIEKRPCHAQDVQKESENHAYQMPARQTPQMKQKAGRNPVRGILDDWKGIKKELSMMQWKLDEANRKLDLIGTNIGDIGCGISGLNQKMEK